MQACGWWYPSYQCPLFPGSGLPVLNSSFLELTLRIDKNISVKALFKGKDIHLIGYVDIGPGEGVRFERIFGADEVKVIMWRQRAYSREEFGLIH